jgi:hypothetical protein
MNTGFSGGGGASVAAPTQIILAQSAVPVSHTGDANEFTLATIDLPANSMGPNGSVSIEALFSHTGSAGNFIGRIRFGAAILAGNFQIGAANKAERINNTIYNRNAANSQIFSSNLNSTYPLALDPNPPTTAAIDTTVAVSITITGQVVNAADTITLEAYTVILRPKA